MASKGLMVAGLASGSGKTLITLGLLRAFAKRGLPISPAKTGPDYIDAAFLSAASGHPAINLDSFAMRDDLLQQLAHDQPGEVMLVEGVMGLFDGGPNGVGSSAALAVALELPLVLVLDVRRTAQTAAMLAAGVAALLPKTPIAGVILNHVASARHQRLIADALASVAMPLLGALPPSTDIQVPSRHLGLVQAGDLAADGRLTPLLDAAANLVSSHCDLEAIYQAAAPLSGTPMAAREPTTVGRQSLVPPPAQNIAVARDAAFGFCYEHMLQDWHRRGATITVFSPLNDERPAADAGFIFLPGGYPELHLPRLSTAQNCFSGLRDAAQNGCMIYGECGGFMALGTTITSAEGQAYKMAGLFDLHTSFAVRQRHLGYRKLLPKTDFFWNGPLLGHEFHYTSVTHSTGDALFEAFDAADSRLGETGLKAGNVYGSYGHIIAAS